MNLNSISNHSDRIARVASATVLSRYARVLAGALGCCLLASPQVHAQKASIPKHGVVQGTGPMSRVLLGIAAPVPAPAPPPPRAVAPVPRTPPPPVAAPPAPVLATRIVVPQDTVSPPKVTPPTALVVPPQVPAIGSGAGSVAGPVPLLSPAPAVAPESMPSLASHLIPAVQPPPVNAVQSAMVVGEVLPSSNALAETMQPREAAFQGRAIGPLGAGMESSTRVPGPRLACVQVGFSPDAKRPSHTLVDLSGDGLIVSAVPTDQLTRAYEQAGLVLPDLTQSVRHCLDPQLARSLVQPPEARAHVVARLIPTREGVRLMSDAEWASQVAATRINGINRQSKSKNRNKVAKRVRKSTAGKSVAARRPSKSRPNAIVAANAPPSMR